MQHTLKTLKTAPSPRPGCRPQPVLGGMQACRAHCTLLLRRRPLDRAQYGALGTLGAIEGHIFGAMLRPKRARIRSQHPAHSPGQRDSHPGWAAASIHDAGLVPLRGAAQSLTKVKVCLAKAPVAARCVAVSQVP